MATDLESLGRDAESRIRFVATRGGPLTRCWAVFPIVRISCVVARRMIDVAGAMSSGGPGRL